ncbi:MAG TPA: PhzF family phenazine biosynthesis protein [Bryobacteraceae bacterium]|nr:PhzF family phenazine biosynthesis protein [Bryobacteraceae bacterium]
MPAAFPPTGIVTVDAFTSEAFRGNPAAICILPGPASEEWMKNLAREMNLSETAFLHPENNGYRLRWLTPAIEVDLCGHATLASAHVLWQDGHLAPDLPALFHTRSGLLTCIKNGDWIEMDFPARLEQQAPPPAHLAEALGVIPKYVGKNQFDYLVEVADEATLRTLQPNHHLLRQIPVRGVIATAKGREYDFVSRFFAPGSGIDEDPVTGSAHTALAPFWGARLGRTEMTGYQASARGGVVKVRLAGDRVILSGQAITILRGQLGDAASASAAS